QKLNEREPASTHVLLLERGLRSTCKLCAALQLREIGKKSFRAGRFAAITGQNLSLRETLAARFRCSRPSRRDMLDNTYFRAGVPELRWPIRNQIFVPFVAVVLLAVVAMTAVAAVHAARQRETQTLAQLQNVVETLAHTSVPYTASVLQKMSGLSGAQFV